MNRLSCFEAREEEMSLLLVIVQSSKASIVTWLLSGDHEQVFLGAIRSLIFINFISSVRFVPPPLL